MFPSVGFKKADGSFYPSWTTKQFLSLINNIVDFRGRTPKKLGMDWASEKTGFLALSALNVKSGYIDFSADPHYGDEELYEKWMSGNELRKGQVLFTTEAPMGNVAQVPDDRPYILSQRTIAFDVDEEQIDEGFLAFLLLSPNVQAALSKLATGGTATGISQKSLAKLNVTIPSSIEEQQKIADFLSSVDEVISTSVQEVTNLETQKKAVMKKIFSQEVRFKREDGTDFPEWEEVTVGDVTAFHKQGYYTNEEYVSDGYKIARVSDLYSPVVVYDDMPMVPMTDKDYQAFKIETGDFLIARSGSIGRYGIVYDIPEDSRVVFGSFVIKFQFDVEKITNEYFGQYYSSTFAEKSLKTITQTGANVNINAENIKSMKMLLPCLEEQRLIADFLSSFDEAITTAKKELELWKELKKGLLQQMFV